MRSVPKIPSFRNNLEVQCQFTHLYSKLSEKRSNPLLLYNRLKQRRMKHISNLLNLNIIIRWQTLSHCNLMKTLTSKQTFVKTSFAYINEI